MLQTEQPPLKLVGRLFVCCPANLVTGGPELLHQLVHEVNDLGGDASITYIPAGAAAKAPEAYTQYACPVVTTIPDVDDSIVLVPEVMPAVLRRFKHARLVVWWLSVDNYTRPPGGMVARLVALRRKIITDWPRTSELHHLTQSHYAQQFVAARFGKRATMLGDYIDPAFHQHTETDSATRELRIAFNPKKGGEFIEALRAVLPDATFVELHGMSRAQMIKCLRESVIYVDLGHHPGKDRIPREAAACGCIIVVARRGSAGYWEDMPLDDDYKLDLNHVRWASIAAVKLREIMLNYAFHRARQSNYVAAICCEHAEFSAGVRRIFIPS